MDFLSKLYSNENFGIILFAVISILVLVFLIVLFFGKKDQKDRKLAETNKIDLEKQEKENNVVEEAANNQNVISEVAFKEEQPMTNLEISPAAQMEEQSKNTINTPNLVLNEDLTNPEVPTVPEKIEPVEPILPNGEESVPTPPIPDFDFDALASSISKELESIGVPTSEIEESRPVIEPNIAESALNKLVEETTKKEFKEEPVKQNPIVFDTPKQPEPMVEMTIDKEKVKPISEEKPKMPSPTQFSSVFVNKKKEDPEIREEVVASTSKSVVAPEPVPVKPSFELPKTIDLPKLSSDPTPEPTPVIDENKPKIVFPGLENDIPTYPKNDENRM